MRSRLWLVALAVAGAVLWIAAGTAGAHAVAEGTTPAEGTVLEVGPGEVSVRFNEPVTVRDDGIGVLLGDGTTVEVGPTRSVDTSIAAALPGDLPDGSFIVSWRVVSADGHPVAGAFTFSVGSPSSITATVPTTAPSDAGVDVAQGVANFVAYAGVLAAVGLAVFVVFVHDGGPERRRLVRFGVAAGAAGFIGVVALVPLQAAEVLGRGLGGVGDLSAWGEQIDGTAGTSATVTALGLVVLATASLPRVRSMVLDAVAGAAAVVALGGFVVVGHTRTFGPWWLVTSSDLVHLAAGAMWFGGLVALTLVLRARRSPGTGPAVPVAGTAAVVARFSTLAAASLAAVAAFGVVLAWRIVGSWSGLFDTGWGQALLVKVALVAVVAALGAYNRFALVPAVTGVSPGEGLGRLARTVRVEAVVLVAVLAATAVLVGRSPTTTTTTATNRSETESPSAGPVSATASLGQGTVGVEVTPSRVGPNTLTLTLTGADGQPVEPMEAPQVDLTLIEQGVGPLRRPAAPIGPGWYRVDVDLPLPGTWTIAMTVRTSEYASPSAVLTIDVGA